MILDSSAVVCVVRSEAESQMMIDAIIGASVCKMSAANWLEAAMVVDGFHSPLIASRFELFLREANVDIVALTPELAQVARVAHQSYGRGNHPARLNYGDCFAYALAKVTGEPLLFKGNDFSQTDVRSALAV